MINVTRSSMPPIEEYYDEIKDLWDSHWLTNMGAKHKAFEQQLKSFLNCPNVALYTNGHLALENAIAAFDFPRGSEVITSPFTFVSTTHAITRNGLVPVFADINEDDYTIDPDSIEKLITEKTVAIVPIHVYGNICNIEKISGIAEKYGLKVIYDAAHAFAVEYKGVSAANFGDVSMFSFHATKVFQTIEGGALCYADSSLTQLFNDLKNFGIHGRESIEYIGGNAKMNEFQAAMGICNLRHLSEEIEKRKAVYNRYNELLSGIQGIKLYRANPDVKPNYAYYPVLFDGYKKTRDEIFTELKQQEIVARKYFYPLTNDCEAYRGYPTAGADKTPVAAHVSKNILTLPIYSDLSLNDVDRICSIIKG